MTTIFLTCVKTKRGHACRAEQMYCSTYFHAMIGFAKSLHPDHIYILSAKYGLLELQDWISPYELALKNMSTRERREWAGKVIRQMKAKNINFQDRTVFLGGKEYRQYLINLFPNAIVPLDGMGFGTQIQWLKRHTR